VFPTLTDSIGYFLEIPPEVGEYELSYLVTSFRAGLENLNRAISGVSA
jgi:hypothetical protein